MPHILALDEGTTSARAALYNEAGERLAMASRPIESEFPAPGWVEQDAELIWHAQVEAVKEILASRRDPIGAIGITNQRETTIAWDRVTGKPVSPAIVWQCRRTADFCRELAGCSDAKTITEKTGLVVDAYFSASKLKWILDNVEDARAKARNGDLLFGTVETWLIWRLTEGAVHVTDHSNASRTMLMNIETGEWDDELLRMFDVPKAMLPRIVPSAGTVGVTRLFGDEIPICGVAGDQQAALAGQVCFSPGLSKNTYGTGCFALMHTGGDRPRSANRLLATRAASTNAHAQYAIEGSIFIAGAAVQWLRDKLGVIKTAAESEPVARSVPNSEGVYVVPAFVGLGAPYWNPSVRAAIIGMTLGTTTAHIVRATLESIAYQTRELIDAMQADSGAKLHELRVDGGAASNDFLMQFQADILGCRIVRPKDVETTALGAAFLAGLSAGIWKDTEELESFWQRDRVFEPAMPADQREELFRGWKSAVEHVL